MTPAAAPSPCSAPSGAEEDRAAAERRIDEKIDECEASLRMIDDLIEEYGRDQLTPQNQS